LGCFFVLGLELGFFHVSKRLEKAQFGSKWRRKGYIHIAFQADGTCLSIAIFRLTPGSVKSATGEGVM
jgi:hypothetical protein